MCNNKWAGISLAVSISLVSGCGGGGGGGGVIATPTIPFTSYTAAAAVAKPAIIVMSGSSQESTYTFNTGTGKITSLSAASAFSNGGSITGTFNAGGVETNLTAVSALGTTISLTPANGDVIGALTNSTSVLVSYNASQTKEILSPNRGVAPMSSWDYQSFGIWATGVGTGSGTVGVMSAGAETAGASVPTVGTFSFTGVTGGRYADGLGNPFFTVSDMSATANFATRSIAFATTGTLTTTDFITGVANNNLNMTGTLTYASGSNQFTGAVTTVGGGVANAAMTGTASGKFYGPTAQEMGGTFAVSGGSVTGYIGGFGAKR